MVKYTSAFGEKCTSAFGRNLSPYMIKTTSAFGKCGAPHMAKRKSAFGKNNVRIWVKVSNPHMVKCKSQSLIYIRKF